MFAEGDKDGDGMLDLAEAHAQGMFKTSHCIALHHTIAIRFNVFFVVFFFFFVSFFFCFYVVFFFRLLLRRLLCLLRSACRQLHRTNCCAPYYNGAAFGKACRKQRSVRLTLTAQGR